MKSRRATRTQFVTGLYGRLNYSKFVYHLPIIHSKWTEKTIYFEALVRVPKCVISLVVHRDKMHNLGCDGQIFLFWYRETGPLDLKKYSYLRRFHQTVCESKNINSLPPKDFKTFQLEYNNKHIITESKSKSSQFSTNRRNESKSFHERNKSKLRDKWGPC